MPHRKYSVMDYLLLAVFLKAKEGKHRITSEMSDSGSLRAGRGTETKNHRAVSKMPGQGESSRELTVLKGNEFLWFLLSSRAGATP